MIRAIVASQAGEPSGETTRVADLTKPSGSTKSKLDSKTEQEIRSDEAKRQTASQVSSNSSETSVVDAVKNAGKKFLAKAAQVGGIATNISSNELNSSSSSSTTGHTDSDNPAVKAAKSSRSGLKTTGTNRASTKAAEENTIKTKTAKTKSRRTKSTTVAKTKKKNAKVKSAAQGSPKTKSSPTKAAPRSQSSAAGLSATSQVNPQETALPARYQVGTDTRQKMIEDAAYFMAEKRNFMPGFEDQDWLAAEELIDRLIEEAVPTKAKVSGSETASGSNRSTDLHRNNPEEATTNG